MRCTQLSGSGVGRVMRYAYASRSRLMSGTPITLPNKGNIGRYLRTLLESAMVGSSELSDALNPNYYQNQNRLLVPENHAVSQAYSISSSLPPAPNNFSNLNAAYPQQWPQPRPEHQQLAAACISQTSELRDAVNPAAISPSVPRRSILPKP